MEALRRHLDLVDRVEQLLDLEDTGHYQEQVDKRWVRQEGTQGQMGILVGLEV